MTALQKPAPDAPAEEWGRFATQIPDWRWMAGALGRGGSLGQMLVRLRRGDEGLVASDVWPDPDDPATAGCLLALLGNLEKADELADSLHLRRDECAADAVIDAVMSGAPGRISRACIAAADALGRWPGGDS